MKIILLSIAVLGLSAPAVMAQWAQQSIAIGQRDNPKILARFGGPIQDAALAAYVDSVGRDLVSVSSRSGENWSFTVLDSPEVNAFALPGGFVFVTRGLLALANSEAELAAVLAHEISHVIDEHVEQREANKKDAVIDGAFGALAQAIFAGASAEEAIRDNIVSALDDIGANSREQEFEADSGGIILLALAGYDANAQADFLLTMAANTALLAAMAGQNFDPTSVSRYANHPAAAARQLAARELADGLTGKQNKIIYLQALDGLLFGENTKQGLVRGQVFIHPELGFTFRAADGLTINNTPRQINIIGPNGATLVMTGAADHGIGLTNYLSDWVGSLPRRDRIGRRMARVNEFTLNGLEAATTSIGYRRGARRGDMQLTVIRFNGGLIRFAGFSRNRGSDIRDALMATVRSFERIEPDTLEPLSRYQILIHQVTGHNTPESLAANFPPSAFNEEMFRVLNGMGADDVLTRGSLVKVIVKRP